MTSRSISTSAIPHEIDIGAVMIRRPMLLKIVQENVPVVREAVFLEVLEREGKPVVNSDQRRRFFRESLDQPFRDALACPVSTEARGRRNFAWIVQMISRIDT